MGKRMPKKIVAVIENDEVSAKWWDTVGWMEVADEDRMAEYIRADIAEDLIETGLEYARDALLHHLDAYGESTPTNQLQAERIRADIRRFEAAKLNQKEGE